MSSERGVERSNEGVKQSCERLTSQLFHGALCVEKRQGALVLRVVQL